MYLTVRKDWFICRIVIYCLYNYIRHMKSILSLWALLIFSTAFGQTYDLRFNLIKGADYWQSNSVSSIMHQKINGQEVATHFTVYGRIKFHVNDVQDSTYDIEASFESLSLSLASDQIKVNHSSEDSSDDISSKIYRSMVNRPFALQMSNRGKIRKLAINSIFEHALDQISQLTDEQKHQIMEQFKQTFGEKAFISNFEMLTAMFPNAPVKQGDEWTVRNNLNSIANLDVNTTYRLKEITSNAYIIEGDGKMNSHPPDYSMLNGMPTKVSMNGYMNYSVSVDKATGWIVSASIQQNLSATIEIKDNETISGGMIIPTTYITEIKVGTH